MSDCEVTRQSLLVRIRNPNDREAWSEFVEIYSPLVYRVICRYGLQPADAADVSQDVLRTVFGSLDKFEIGNRGGSFRSWLATIARTRTCNFLQRSNRQVAGSGDTRTIRQLAEQPAPDEADEEMEREYQRSLLRWAAGKIRHEFHETTWQAFRLTHIDGQSCQCVADQLGMSLEAVYMARSRVVARLRKKIREVEN